MKNKNKTLAKKVTTTFSKDNIALWITNDKRSIREKALIMIHAGMSDKAVCRWLDITSRDIEKWLHVEYEHDNAMIKLLNSKLRIPGNYSSWINGIVCDSWNNYRTEENIEKLSSCK
jgi:hypothetical protein